MQMKALEANSLEKYMKKVMQIADSTDSPLWFRGQSKFENKLKPSLLRKDSIRSTTELSEEEQHLLHKFDQRDRPYMSERQIDEFEKLFIMQHYGFPTRLLDWSENPHIGLYFALANPEFDGAVYIMKPAMWNELSLKGIEGGTRRILHTDDEFVDVLRPSKMRTGHQNAVAIYAAHNTTRIIAQRGVFTLFGAGLSTGDEQYEGFTVENLTTNTDSD